MLFKYIHAYDSDASNYSDYGGPSTDYTFGHSSPGMESPAGSTAAYNASLATTPSELRFVDASANIGLEAHRFAFVAGIYNRLRTPIHVKGIDVDINGYGIVELHLDYHDGHSRELHIRATHAPGISERGAPTISPNSIYGNGTSWVSTTLPSDSETPVTPMGASSSSCTTIFLIYKPFPVSSLPSFLTKVMAPRLMAQLCGTNALATPAETP
jgi:hypothetical protein